MAILLALLGPLGDFLIKFWKARQPPPVVTEAEKAGAATAQLQTEETANAQVAEARTASDAVLKRAVVEPGSVRDVDPDSRD